MNKTYYEVLNLSDPNKRSQYDEYLSLSRQEPDDADDDQSFAWQFAFDVKPHTFDEEGYKE